MMKIRNRKFFYAISALVLFAQHSPIALAMEKPVGTQSSVRKFSITGGALVRDAASIVACHGGQKGKPQIAAISKKQAPSQKLAMATSFKKPTAEAVTKKSQDIQQPKNFANISTCARQVSPCLTESHVAVVAESRPPLCVASTPHRLIPVKLDLPELGFGTHLAMNYQIVPKVLDAATIDEIERIIDYRFINKEFLVEALTTRAKNASKNYERFEFLGDKILDAIIAQILLQKYPTAPEGDLSIAREALVSQEPMAALCLRLGLHNYIQDINIVIPISSLCDIVESLIAALYNDGGAQAAQNFVVKFFVPMLPPACPLTGLKIIQRAAKTLRKNIEIVWDEKKLCGFLMYCGDAGFNPTFIKRNTDTKKDANRLALYLAARDFIKSELPDDAKALIKLATGDDYQPLTENSIKLDLKWAEGLQLNYRERLATLMSMLGYVQPYIIQEHNECINYFTCTINIFGTAITGHGFSKSAAQEIVAEIAYKKLQNLILFSKDLTAARVKSISKCNI